MPEEETRRRKILSAAFRGDAVLNRGQPARRLETPF
jgi:hypothetical protein